jgi:crotonobetainyl-CoA:carnitine CoA-transferase CaiB-like acyl-CoA transferase
MTAGALDGIRVVDISQIAAGPYLTSMLGDMGADVIKVEPPAGEPFRRIDHDFASDSSAYFAGINRSKRSLTLSLKSAEGRKVLERLLRGADVFVTAMRPSATARLGIGYHEISRLNPRLIYCSLTAFGEDGPRANEPGMDIIAQAIGGVMATTGEPGRPPVKVGPPISDFVTAFLAGFGICAALRARDRDGVGQMVSLNLLDSTIALIANYATGYFQTKVPVRPVGGGHPQLVPYQAFADSNGKYFIVACLNDNFWAPLCTAIGRPDLCSDSRYATNAGRVAERAALIPELEAIFQSASRETWITRLQAEDVPCSPVYAFEEVFRDTQVVHNGTVIELDHPEIGPYKAIKNPIRMTRSAVKEWGYAPVLGEHTQAILTELGYSAAEISTLVSQDIV